MHRFKTLLRVLRHRSLGQHDTRRAIPPDMVERLRQRVADSEQHHTGQIRIYVEASLPSSYLWRAASVRERAVTLFGKLRVWDTAQNNGVLIYLMLAEHAIELVADRGLNEHVPSEQWKKILDQMRQSFGYKHYEEGLTQALDAVSALLVAQFPATPGVRIANELPDEPVLR